MPLQQRLTILLNVLLATCGVFVIASLLVFIFLNAWFLPVVTFGLVFLLCMVIAVIVFTPKLREV